MEKKHYFIAILPPEPVLGQVRDMKMLLHDRYGCRVALKSPAHITLIPPFHFPPGNEADLVSVLDTYAAAATPFEIELDGFGRFDEQTIYVRVKESPELRRLQFGLHQQLHRELLPKTKKAYDFHPHMTIGNRDIPAGRFEEAFAHFSGRDYQAVFPALSVVLLRLGNGAWETVHEAKLAG